MPAKKASKPKRKSSSSTLTKYSRSRPLGPELKWFDVNTPNSIVGFGLATLIQALNIVPSGTGPNQRIGRTIVVKKKSKSRSTCSSLGLCRSHSPFSRWHQLSCRSHSGQASKRGRCPLEPTSTTLVAGVSPENRFMNLLNSDRFSLVKRWEGDINPPSFIAPDATGSTLIVGRDLRLKKKCSIRVELTLMPPLPSLMLSPTTCCWSSLHPIKTLVVHSELKSSTPPTLASVSGCMVCLFINAESKHSNVLSNSVLKGYPF